jgi:hypothetical protein
VTDSVSSHNPEPAPHHSPATSNQGLGVQQSSAPGSNQGAAEGQFHEECYDDDEGSHVEGQQDLWQHNVDSPSWGAEDVPHVGGYGTRDDGSRSEQEVPGWGPAAYEEEPGEEQEEGHQQQSARAPTQQHTEVQLEGGIDGSKDGGAPEWSCQAWDEQPAQPKPSTCGQPDTGVPAAAPFKAVTQPAEDPQKPAPASEPTAQPAPSAKATEPQVPTPASPVVPPPLPPHLTSLFTRPPQSVPAVSTGGCQVPCLVLCVSARVSVSLQLARACGWAC